MMGDLKISMIVHRKTLLQVKGQTFTNYVRTAGVNKGCAGQPLCSVHFFTGIKVACFLKSKGEFLDLKNYCRREGRVNEQLIHFTIKFRLV